MSIDIKNEGKEIYKRIEKKFSNYLEMNELNPKNLNQEDMDIFIKSVIKANNYNSLSQYKKAIKEILYNFKISSEINYHIIEDTIEYDEHFTRDKIIEICDYIYETNPQDAFIIYALWSGIQGIEYEDLRSLKVFDIEDNFNTICVNNNKIECDEYMKKIIKGAIKQDKYFSYKDSLNNKEVKPKEFNMDSEYIIKVLPRKKNNFGRGKISRSAIERRFGEFSQACTDYFKTEVKLTGTIVENSGIMHKMNNIEIEENLSWKYENIEKFFMANNIKKNSRSIYTKYNLLYHNSENNLYNSKYLKFVKYLFENIKNNMLESDYLLKKFNLEEEDFEAYIKLLVNDCSNYNMPILPIIIFKSSDKKNVLSILTDRTNKDKKNISDYELIEMFDKEYENVINFSDWNILIENLEDKISNKYNEDKEVEFTEFKNDLENVILIEGGKLKKYIEQNKRNQRARELKFKSAKGRLYCEVCKEDAKCVLDVHHDSIQVHDMNEEHLTKLSDLRILCSNCHRKVHFLNCKVDELKSKKNPNFTLNSI